MNRVESWDMILKDANIIDGEGNIFSGKSIYVKDGKIEKILDQYEGGLGEVIECESYFITPGLVNLHSHVPMNILKGLAEDVNIKDWFNKEIFPYESKLTPMDVYYGALLGISEMIDNGVTSFADHYFFADKVCDAVIESGIRGDIAPTIFGLSDNFEEVLEDAASLIEKRRNQSTRLSLRMGPHAPYTCPNEKLEKIIKRARELNVGIHIHLSETLEQVEESLKSYGKTPFKILSETGGFDIPAIIAHGLWISEEDLNYTNDNTYVAVCPKTYMKLGMGYGGLWNNYDRLQLCIGTDGAASSNTLNPLEQLRLFALIGKAEGKSENFKLKSMWQMLMRGHKALDFNTGDIKVGYDADLLVWDLNMTNTYPIYNPLTSIIYSSESKNILHSIVEGKFVKRNGKVVLKNTSLWNEIERTSKEILSKGKGTNKISY
ncbi:amidohydrolase family protein [Clostridium sp. HMP27]|uniref:amidohydrolase family protein n=1 Tax=Clostridium sp. HMP27 TaxID=1487921 RepID=UPI00052D9641|nr:amidohydrolase family protein [Clostridium sp. HMP27]KGK88819.1 cytosine deaminase [Clostridium sp. HMP27]